MAILFAIPPPPSGVAQETPATRPSSAPDFHAAGHFSAATTASGIAAPAFADPGPGGPVLVLTDSSDGFGAVFAEILRNEGLNEFGVADLAGVTAATLNSYDVVILAQTGVTAAHVTMFTDWVNAGGNLITVRPDEQLAGLLGLGATAGRVTDGYLLVDTSTAPGTGIVGQTIQFHGPADRYVLNGATSVAALYTTATAPTSNPAVTLHSVGTDGGQAAAFTYDLARSIVYTRQGNPAWASQERDDLGATRSNDLFFGNASGDPEPDWVDLHKVAIPQADEQQRLLANLILHMNVDRKPLPRFWYFPNGERAVVIMTGDDHGNGGTDDRFDRNLAQSPAGCSVAEWECVRSTSYIFTDTPLSDAQAAAYSAQGFEVGLHVDTGCANYTAASLDTHVTTQLAAWQAKYTSLPSPTTSRTHCIVWSDWASKPIVESAHGIRLNTDYYYWPENWVDDRPGFMTGSGMPMRFANLDGSLIDSYGAATQMTDESGQSYPSTPETLLDRAVGSEGYYGVFTVNAHTDADASVENDTVVSAALARGVPVVSARQMLTWLDGRNASSFSNIAWTGDTLTFGIRPGAGADGLRAMIPMSSGNQLLQSVTENGRPVSYTVEEIKGVEYAFVSAVAGTYAATYGADTAPSTMQSTRPVNGATGVSTDTIGPVAPWGHGTEGHHMVVED